MTQVMDALKALNVFDGLDAQLLQKLADIAECVEFPEHKRIFREGDAATDVFFITDGSVVLEICARGWGCRRILTVGEGELLGWSPVLEQQRLSATARALIRTEAIKLNGRQILTICEHDPRFGYEFMKPRGARARQTPQRHTVAVVGRLRRGNAANRRRKRPWRRRR